MQRHFTLFAAAALSAGTFAFLGYDSTLLAADRAGEMPGRTGIEARPAVEVQLPQGITRSDQSDVQGIRSSLAKSVDSIVSEGGKDLSSYLAPSDRNRLKDWDPQKYPQLTQALTQFRNDWKAKYGQDFSLSGKEQVVFGPDFREFYIVQGEVSNPALLGNWPVEPTDSRMQPRPGTDQQRSPDMPGETGRTDPDQTKDAGATTVSPAGGSVGGPPTEPPGVRPGEAARPGAGNAQAGAAQLERGDNVAIVHFPQAHGIQAFTASLVREGKDAGDWRIDIPDNITAQQLSTSLQNHITKCVQMKDQWPADVNEAYRTVSHQLLLALYDTGQMQRRPGAIEGRDMHDMHNMHQNTVPRPGSPNPAQNPGDIGEDQ